MSEDKFYLALVDMEAAQDELVTYSLLLNRAKSSLTASMHAFERASSNLTTANCPVNQKNEQLRGQYIALTSLTAAIVDTLATPMFSKLIANASNRLPLLLVLLELLPEAERDLLNTAITALFVQGKGEIPFLSAEQVELAQSILAST